MEIILAKSAGFCFGVQRAVDTAYKEAGKKHVYTYGPIIHNEEVIEDLRKKGISVIDDLAELDQQEDETVIIRSHGVSKDVMDQLEARHVNVVDATCPFVKKIHTIAQDESKKGNRIIIVGNKDHPEVEGIIGWCETKAYTVQSVSEADDLVKNIENEPYFEQINFSLV